MKAAPELFELIKSLNGSEKGYFKKHSAIKTASEKGYLKLFDAIEKQKEYNEKILRDQFKHEKFARQFPVMKSYLYDRILTSLDSYHDSIHETIRHYLHHAEILFEKGLYKQANKIILKAKKIAIRFELHVYLPEITQWEHSIASEKLDFKKRLFVLNEYKDTLSVLENIRFFQLLSARMGMFIQKHGEEKKTRYFIQIKKMMKHPSLKNVSSALSITAKIKFYYLHTAYWYLQYNYGKAYGFLEKEFALYENNLEKINIHFQSYVSCLYRLLGISLKLKNYSAFEKYIETIKNATSLTKNYAHKAKLFHGYSNFSTDYVILTGEFDKGKKLIPEILKEYDNYESELNPHEKTFILINIAIIWFGNEEYSKCLSHLNKIRNELPNIFPDAERFLHIFYILVHYEAKHFDLLPHLAQSSVRFLEKEKNIGKFEKIMFEFFDSRLSQADTKQKQTEVFATLKKELQPIFKEKGKETFFIFDYESWIESKIEGEKFSEIVKEKSQAVYPVG